MTGVFACPDCGRTLELEGLAPGRQVQCDACSAWVEVPFLPRVAGRTRPRPGKGRRGRAWWESKALRGALAFSAIALGGLAVAKLIGGRVRSGHERVLAELVDSADRAEASRRYDVALREIEGALAHARTFERDGSSRLVELAGRRDRIAIEEAEARLSSLAGLEPDPAVGEALTLAERARRDPALASLAGSIDGALDEARTRQARGDLEQARAALHAGRDAEAFAAAARLHDRAGSVPDPEGRRLRAEALAVVEAAIGRSGVALPPVSGRFLIGSSESLTLAVEKGRVEALRLKGYLPQSRDPSWAPLWAEKAPFRLGVEVVETQEGNYLQSKNRTSLIEGVFELTQRGRPAWSVKALGRTRSPIPDLPAYRAGHLATAPRRDPEVERYFHDDALKQFVEQANRNLRGLPERKTLASKL